MNTDDPFAPRPKTGGASAAEESPEDFLFAVPEDTVKNPYDSDSGFDEASESGFGPCAFDDTGSPESTFSTEEDQSLSEFDLDWSAGPVAPAAPQDSPPAEPEEITAGRSNDRAADLMPPPAPPKPRSTGGASVLIPGRNRVSYSQGRTTGLRPAAVAPQKVVHKNSFLSWAAPAWLFLVGCGAGGYLGFVAGSPVLAVVSGTVGAFAALFCRVLLRK